MTIEIDIWLDDAPVIPCQESKNFDIWLDDAPCLPEIVVEEPTPTLFRRRIFIF